MKIVMLGDGSVGNTALWHWYTKGKPFLDYIPTGPPEIQNISIQLDGKTYVAQLVDTPGQEDYDRLRSLVYADVDVAIIMFSVANPDTFANIESKWIPEFRHFCPKTPILLVGNKTDLRDDPTTLNRLLKFKQEPITYKLGKKLASEINAVKYMECSSLTGSGVSDVIQQSARAAIRYRLEKVIKNKRTKESVKARKVKTCAMLVTHCGDTIDPPVAVHYL